MRILLAALALTAASPLLAQENAAWRSVDAQTGQIRDLDGLTALAEAFPDSSSVRLRLLNAQLGAEDFYGLKQTLRWLMDRGYVFSEVARDQIPKLVGEKHAEDVAALLIRDVEVIEASEVVATVPAEAGLIESVFAPESTPLMVATSVTGNSVHIYTGDQSWTSIAIPGANDLSGIVGEPDDSMGWAASANLDESEDAEEFFTGLIGLRGDFQNPVLVPAPEGAKAVSDLTISPDATVYASDPIGGGIYRKPVGATELEVLVAPGTFRSPQGLAISADKSRLYVSDYRYGLAMINLGDGSVSRLQSDVPAILDGVDGLWRHGDRLIAMQNGTSPMRISAFTLSDDGLRISAVETLEQAHPGWTEPLGGSISGDALVYVATGQWDRFVKGEPAQDKPPIPTDIRRLPLASGQD
ncbi:hypothetical protein NAP1_05935 [Erythrobacter sp. NAP1]|uniref:hypothetical protein n=1 Tax=Erythrobacter sp. NAP1 TaxID=237727 RepID=UPI0000686BA0|nr:hypothetical protein [Erythrobacter sp. NAP1]EAQ30293.1 hypothetical protein NAP1_05935 [Erythrobacter sp. NAP1]